MPSSPTRPVPSRPAGPAAAAPIRRPIRRPDHRPGTGPWQLALGLLGALALIATCGVAGFFLVADELRGNRPRAAAPLSGDFGGRGADPAPLTLVEVFPGPVVTISPDAPGYPVLATEISSDCAGAVTGRLSGLLAEAGCTQVVRGTLRSPDGRYLVTTGVLKLTDAINANRTYHLTKVLVDRRQGTFRGLVAGPGTAAVAQPSTPVRWHVRGHFLVYCVIARADGHPLWPSSPATRGIEADLIGRHLRGRVLTGRTVAG